VVTAANDELASNAGKTPAVTEGSLSELPGRPEIANCSGIAGSSDLAGCSEVVNFSNTTSSPEMPGCPEMAGFSETTKYRTEAATVAEVKKVASNRKAFRVPVDHALDIPMTKTNRSLTTATEGQPALIYLSLLILSQTDFQDVNVKINRGQKRKAAVSFNLLIF
jgi:hypothetical protein